MLTKDEHQKLDETHDTVIELRTVLLGADGNEGLCAKVEKVAKSHYKLKSYFWILVAFLVGTGIITGGIIGLLR